VTPADVEQLKRSRYVLLDFDGPVCSAFAGYPAPEVADALKTDALDAGIPVPAVLANERDPMKVLLGLWEVAPQHHERAEALLASAEVTSVATASPTPGAIPFLRACAATRRPVAVVSNNSPECVLSFLEKHDLAPLVKGVFGREKASPRLMKPNPHLPLLALRALEAETEATILVGDSTTDIEVAHAVGAVAVGYANRLEKLAQFEELHVDVVVDHMDALAEALVG
jgi:phosphoglycolate phosphatase-like HAD superfamily hydrolase